MIFKWLCNLCSIILISSQTYRIYGNKMKIIPASNKFTKIRNILLLWDITTDVAHIVNLVLSVLSETKQNHVGGDKNL